MTDILIIGAGVAGLYTALKLAPRPVTVVTARPLGEAAASVWAQGGMAAAVGPDDSAKLHLADTLGAGAGLVDAEAATILAEGGAFAVEELTRYGVKFDRLPDGSLKLGREAAHCRDRIVHATGDRAGAAIMDALIKAVRAAPHIAILEQVVIEDLLRSDDGGVGGVLAYDFRAGKRFPMRAAETVLATGGLGGLYAVTTNPTPAQGHGLAFAARAGAVIRDPEFVQFHPTALDIAVDPAPLATEALRGEGAHLVNRDGRRFMPDYHKGADLAPRDIVARAVEAERAAGRGAFLDAQRAIGEKFPLAFPTVFAACQRANIDPRTELMPVAPAAHYHMGGVMVDLDGRSTLEGLSAVGECASTGVHGANRLASNSLLEAVVFGARIAERLKDAALRRRDGARAPADRLTLAPVPAPAPAMKALREAMSKGAALIRTEDSLAEVIDALARLGARKDMTSGLKSALATAELIAQGAIAREESRGAHYRADFPETDDERFHTELCVDVSSVEMAEP
jgi:L-aspartate oxidase